MIDLKLVEENRCPVTTCGMAYVRHGTGYERGIYCANCGYLLPIDKYKSVMSEVVQSKFINQKEDNEEELCQ